MKSSTICNLTFTWFCFVRLCNAYPIVPFMKNYSRKERHASQRPYLCNAPRHPETELYRSAGVLPYYLAPSGGVFVLLGKELSSERKKSHIGIEPQLMWSILGGKRNTTEHPCQTACRELWEETGKTLDYGKLFLDLTQTSVSSTRASKRAETRISCLWWGAGKYFLYYYRIPSAAVAKWLSLPSSIAASANDSDGRMTTLHWVPLSLLVTHVLVNGTGVDGKSSESKKLLNTGLMQRYMPRNGWFRATEAAAAIREFDDPIACGLSGRLDALLSDVTKDDEKQDNDKILWTSIFSEKKMRYTLLALLRIKEFWEGFGRHISAGH